MPSERVVLANRSASPLPTAPGRSGGPAASSGQRPPALILCRHPTTACAVKRHLPPEKTAPRPLFYARGQHLQRVQHPFAGFVLGMGACKNGGWRWLLSSPCSHCSNSRAMRSASAVSRACCWQCAPTGRTLFAPSPVAGAWPFRSARPATLRESRASRHVPDRWAASIKLTMSWRSCGGGR